MFKIILADLLLFGNYHMKKPNSLRLGYCSFHSVSLLMLSYPQKQNRCANIGH